MSVQIVVPNLTEAQRAQIEANRLREQVERHQAQIKRMEEDAAAVKAEYVQRMRVAGVRDVIDGKTATEAQIAMDARFAQDTTLTDEERHHCRLAVRYYPKGGTKFTQELNKLALESQNTYRAVRRQAVRLGLVREY